jgi:ribulose-phosphate 3-epimerase
VRDIRIAPSLLSADFSRLGEAIRTVEDAGVTLLHVDVMDGHFVPNITFGPIIVKAIRKLAKSELDVHLMISDPATYLEKFIEAGASYVTFHVEAIEEAGPLLARARALGAKAGIAINPETSLDMARPVLEACDLVVMMTVHPGFGGQGFIRDVVPKIKALRDLREAEGLGFEIEVDGGVNLETAPLVARAGGDILVAGAAVFKSEDPAGAVRAIAQAARRGLEEAP